MKKGYAEDQAERQASIKKTEASPDAPVADIHVVPDGVTITFGPKNAPGPGVPPAPVEVPVDGKVA